MTTRIKRSWFAWLNYAVVVLVWGSTYFATVLAFKTFTPLGMLATRFAIAAGLCLMVGVARREALPAGWEWVHLCVVGAGMLGISNALIVWGMQYVPSGMAAVFMALTPLWLTLFGFKGETFGRFKLAGIALGIVGVAILVAPDPSHTLHRGGLAAMFAAPVIWALGTLYSKRFFKRGPTFVHLGIEMLMASIFAFTLVPFTTGILVGPLTATTLLAMAYLSVVGSFIAYASYFYLVQVWEPSRVGTFTYLTPVIAIVLGTLFLQETLSARQVVGMCVVLVGVALVQMKSNLKRTGNK